MTAPVRVNRASWSETLSWLANRFVQAVHAHHLPEPERQEGIRRAIWHLLSLTPPEGTDAVAAALTAVAVMVPPMRDPDTAIAWVRALGDELDWVEVPA